MSARPDSRRLILPSILSCDFARAKDDILDALAACCDAGVGGDAIHVDVMDGHQVPNISFGPPIIAKLRKALPGVWFDTHLMIEEPVRYAKAMRDAGADHVTIQVEAAEVKHDPAAAIAAIKDVGLGVGITLKPGTPLEAILPVVDQVDIVLVMSVEPGFGGQKFMEDQLDKVRRLKPMLRDDQRLEIDGGIGVGTFAQAHQAGIEWFVVGSALFDAKDRVARLREMI